MVPSDILTKVDNYLAACSARVLCWEWDLIVALLRILLPPVLSTGYDDAYGLLDASQAIYHTYGHERLHVLCYERWSALPEPHLYILAVWQGLSCRFYSK